MRFKIIEMSIWSTVTAAIICIITGACLHHFPQGLALFLGALWGSLNLFFLKEVLQKIVLDRKRLSFFLMILICVKWPLLYLIGYVLLKNQYLPSLYLAIGFSMIFVMMFLVSCIGSVKSHAK